VGAKCEGGRAEIMEEFVENPTWEGKSSRVKGKGERKKNLIFSFFLAPWCLMFI